MMLVRTPNDHTSGNSLGFCYKANPKQESVCNPHPAIGALIEVGLGFATPTLSATIGHRGYYSSYLNGYPRGYYRLYISTIGVTIGELYLNPPKPTFLVGSL